MNSDAPQVKKKKFTIPQHDLTGYERRGDFYVSRKDLSSWLTATAEQADRDKFPDVALAFRMFRDCLNRASA